MNQRIGDVAKELKVSVQSIRVWENKGLIPKPNRTPLGHRQYTDQDLQTLRNWLQNNN